MKFIALVAAAGVANAAKTEFPAFDTFHAHCEMSHIIKQDCQNVYPVLDSTLKNFADPARGTYTIKEDALNDYVWTTRLTSGKKYTDDVIFELEADTAGCKVAMKSRSQSLSYIDYNTNYCNMYNVLRSTFNVEFGDVTFDQCKFPAETLDACDKN